MLQRPTCMTAEWVGWAACNYVGSLLKVLVSDSSCLANSLFCANKASCDVSSKKLLFVGIWVLSRNMAWSLPDPNFVRGLSFTDVLILASQTALFDTSYHTRWKIIQCFDQECERYQKEGQKGLFTEFLGPWLAQASLWLTWAPKLLQPEGTNSLGQACYFRSKHLLAWASCHGPKCLL